MHPPKVNKFTTVPVKDVLVILYTIKEFTSKLLAVANRLGTIRGFAANVAWLTKVRHLFETLFISLRLVLLV